MHPDPAQLFRAHRVHVTAQRIAVLRAVAGNPHCTADDVAEQVRTELGTISRQAVYDVLGLLAEKGIIRRIQPAGSPARYEDRVGDNHHHLICRTCGKTVDVNCAVGYTPCLTASHDAGYLIDEAEVIYWGTCPDCLTASGETRHGHKPAESRNPIRTRQHDGASSMNPGTKPKHRETKRVSR